MTCCILIIFLSTTGSSYALPVHNISTGLDYATISAAVNAVSTVNGNTITVDPGTYNEQVLVNKGLIIKNSNPTLPIIDYTGVPGLVSGKLTLFEVTAPNVRIEGMEFRVNVSTLGSAIVASSATLNNFQAYNNTIYPYRSSPTTVSFGLRNAISINYGAYRINSVNPVVTVSGNTVAMNSGADFTMGTSDDANFRAGISADEAGGIFTSNIIQTVSQDIELRFGGAGNIDVTSNNIIGGGVEISDFNAGAGIITVQGNTFNGAIGAGYSSSLRLKDNDQNKTTFVTGNTFTMHNWGISLENFRNVTIQNNGFTPFPGSTNYRHITINTKAITTSSATVTQIPIDAIIIDNNFMQSGITGGYGIAFFNHDDDNDSYGTFTIGTSGAENTFDLGIGKFIFFDTQTGSSLGSVFPPYNVMIGVGASAITTMAFWSQNIDASNNKFNVGSGFEKPSVMSLANLFKLEDKIQHAVDASGLGFVTVKANNSYVTTNSFASPVSSVASIQRGVDAASNGFTVNVNNGTYTENLLLNKEVTLSGANANVSCSAGRGAESVITTSSGNGSTAVSILANNVTVNGFTISNPSGSYGIYNKCFNSSTVKYNIITQIGNITTGAGASYGFVTECDIANIANINVTENCINNIRGGKNPSLVGNPAKANNGSGVAIGAGFSTTNFDISGLSFTNNKINAITASTADFTDGGKGAYGVLINVGANPVNTGKAISPLVQNNEITNLEGLWAHGVGLEGETPGALVLNNYIDGLIDHKGNTDALGVLLEQNDGASTVSIRENSFTNMAFALKNLMPPTVNATCNWFGSAVPGTVASKIVGPFTYTPYLTVGTDNSPATGFQPVPGCLAPCALLLTPASTDATCPSNNNGTASVSVIGGTGTYTYSWTPGGGATATITGLTAGVYVVTVTDVNGCTASTSVTVSNSLAGPVHNINTGLNYCTIQAAINAGATINGHVITVDAGTYDEDVNVNKELSIKGAGAGTTSIRGIFGGDGATVRISANNVEIAGFTITRLGNNTTDWNNPALNTAGIAIQGTSITGTLIRDNIFTGNRTGIDINNSNSHTIRNNDITFNRTGLIFRNQTDNLTIVENNINDNWTVGVLFLDGSGGTNSPVQTALNSNVHNNNISNNWYGQIQDRQSGGSIPLPGTNQKNFTCNWYGTTSPVKVNTNSTEPGYAAQIPVAYGGTATPPGGQPHIGGTASANIIYIPYLVSGTDVNIESTPGWGTNGFQPAAGCIAPCAALIVTPASTPSHCPPVADGTATVSVFGGSGSYTFLWTPGGQTTNPAVGLAAGTYSVLVTDINGCTGSTNVTVGLTGKVHNINTGMEYCSIQSAINDPLTLNTHTIVVDAGTYNENITINKSLTIKGANAGINCASGRGPESIISAAGPSGSVAVNILADGVTLDGFKITNPSGSYGVYEKGFKNITVQFNIIDFIGNNTTGSAPTYGVSIEMGASADISNIQISDNCISNIRGGENTSLTGAAGKANNGSGVGIGAGFSTANQSCDGLLILRNMVTNISASTIDFNDGGKGAYGVLINVGANNANPGKVTNASIKENEISNLNGHWAHGIGLEGETPGAIVLNNTISNLTDSKPVADAVCVLIEDNAGAATISIRENSLTNSELSLKNLMPPTVDATCNWYGSPSLSFVTSKISGSFVYAPYLLVGTDNSTAIGFQPVPGCVAPCALILTPASTDATCPLNNNGTASVSVSGGTGVYTYSWSPGGGVTATITGLNAGVYIVTVTDANGCTASTSVTVSNSLAGPVHNINTGLNYCTIQSAINDALTLNGHTITVDPGVYPENVTLNKSLTIRGAKSGVDARGRVVGVPNPLVESVVGTGTSPAFNLQAVSSNSIIDGFALIGNPGGTDGVISNLAAANLTNITIKNNYIKATGSTGAAIWMARSIVDLTLDKNEIIGSTAGTQVIFLSTNSYNGLFVTNNNILGSGGVYGIFVDGNRNVGTSLTPRNPLIQSNLFEGHQAAINAGSRSLENAQVLENTFNNNSVTGFQGGPKNSNFARNTFSNNTQYGMSLTAFGSVDPLRGGQGTTIQNNFFFNNGNTPGILGTNRFGDILLSNQTAGTQNSNTIVNNSLLSTISIYNNEPDGGTDPVHATCNWFGSTNPATVAAKIINIPGGITLYSPWLTSGTDVDLVTPGFQPAAGCIAPCALVLTPSSTPSHCPPVADGTASVSVSGGTGSYTYLWTPGVAVSSTATGLAEGTYSVLVTDANGCTSSISVTVGLIGKVHNLNTGKEYCTIQSAINDPLTVNGNVISVDAGTYNENITINKSLTLTTANAGIDCAGGRGPESIISAAGPSGSIAVLILADNVTITGFTITNPAGSYGVQEQGFNHINVSYNIITSIGNNSNGSFPTYGVSIVMGNTADMQDVQITDNCINNIRGGENTALTGAPAKANNGSGVAIGAGFSTANYNIEDLVILRNRIDNIKASIQLFDDGGKGAYGVLINVGANAAFTGKAINPIISQNEINNLEGLWAHGIGLEGETPGAFVVNNIVNNLIDHKSGTDAVSVKVEQNDGAASINIHENSFTNSTLALVNTMLPTVSATCNWYGTNAPAIVTSKVIGPFSYTPYLVSGIDVLPVIGFQPLAGCVAPCALTLNTGSNPASCPSFNNGVASVNVTSGEPGPFIYSWSNGATTQVATGLTPGNYSVTVTNINGCTATASVTVGTTYVAPAKPADVTTTVECAPAVAPTPPIVTDVCGTPITPSAPAISGTYVSCEGTKIYTYTYTDIYGGTTTWVRTYNVDHTIPPAEFGGPVSSASMVQCESAAVPPALPVFKDVCGNIVAPGAPALSGTYNTTTSQTIVSDLSWSVSTDNPVSNLCTNGFWNGVGSIPANGTYTVAPVIGNAGNATTVIPGTTPLLTSSDVRFYRKTFNLTTLSGIQATLLSSVDNAVQIWINGFPVALESSLAFENFNDANFSRIVINSVGPNVNGGPGYQVYDNITAADASSLFVVGLNEIVLAVANCAGDDGTTSFEATITTTGVSCEGTIIYTYNYTDCSGLNTPWSYTYTVSHTIPPVVPVDGSSTVQCESAATTPVPPVVQDVCGANIPAVLTNTSFVTTQSQMFNFTGGVQTFIVPAGITSLNIKAFGAEGGGGSSSQPTGILGIGGLGGSAEGNLAVVPGSTIRIYVGGKGMDGDPSIDISTLGGYNGGGLGGYDNSTFIANGGGGGGASDVRVGGTALINRVIVAAGGGGASGGKTLVAVNGGDGGGSIGENGDTGGGPTLGVGGTGGTQSNGGIADIHTRGAGDGLLGVGGKGSFGFEAFGSGGGGGGYYGGGGGTSKQDHGDGDGGGGGGGSSYLGGVTGGATAQGVRAGNGQVILSWAAAGCTGTKTYTYTYTDCSGLSSEWDYVYTIDHTTPPSEFGGPVASSSTVQCTTDAVVPSVLPVVKDVCGTILAPSSSTGPVFTPVSPGSCEGTVVYTYTYTDCDGLQFVWTYTYTIDRTTLPSEFGGPVATTSTIQCVSGAVPPVLPVVKDACGEILPAPAPVITNNPVALTCEGTRTYTYTYVDCAGLQFIWTFTYTIDRTTPPSEFGTPVPTSSTLQCLSATPAPAVLPIVKDVCGNTLPTPAPDVITVPASITCEGTVSYKYTYTDCSGLSFEWTYTYTVDRTTPPSEVGPPAVSASTVQCLGSATPPAILPVVKDACGNTIPAPAPVITNTPVAISCEGIRTYTYNYTDCSGLNFAWSYTYTIDHTIAPIVPIPNATATVESVGQATPPIVKPTVADACGTNIPPVLVSITDTPAPLVCVGTREYKYKYEDCSGLTAFWTYTYTLDWDDKNACTNDACNTMTGNVSHTPVNRDDANPCTIDLCDQISGVYHIPVHTDDFNPCTVDACNSITGFISHNPLNVDDGNGCTTDACNSSNGQITHIVVNTDDGNACTVDACNPGTGAITHTAVNVNDNNACTTDACNTLTGQVTHTPANVSDGNACTVDGCDTNGNVIHTAVITDDGNACTTDACNTLTGVVTHAAANTDDGNGCTTDACNTSTGAITHTTISSDDGNACTIDACNTANGDITHVAVNTSDGNACTVDGCNTLTGAQTHVNLPVDDGNACTTDACNSLNGDITHVAVNTDDGNACTNDVCNTSTGTISHPAVITDDGNACTTDACNTTTGQVTHIPLVTDDNNPCTIDVCNTNGVVTHTAVNVDDGNACTTDACNSTTGAITHLAVNTDDGNACTNDVCNTSTGAVTHPAVITDDGNACTTDACNTTTGQVTHIPLVTDDNNPCTIDVCNTNGVVTHTAVNVDDGNACTTDACNSTTGAITHLAVNTDDGNACTNDVCNTSTGAVTHPAVNTDDNNPCTIDGCVTSTGVTHTPKPVDDLNACTIDFCDAATGNVIHTNIDTDDNNPCTADACNTSTGAITHIAISTDDGNACTTDGCNSVTGIFHNPVVINDGNACTVDACNTSTGAITHDAVITEDGNLCTTDACNTTTGQITHIPVNIDDNNLCTTDACNPGTGAITHVAVITDDNNVCTIDGCISTSGVFHNPVSTTDGNACTTDGCDPVNGPYHIPVNTNDGDACTIDGCNTSTGVVSHNALNVNDGNACTIDGCNSTSGPTHTPININDGNACTIDGCDVITGATHTQISTDDFNACTIDACNTVTGAVTHTDQSPVVTATAGNILCYGGTTCVTVTATGGLTPYSGTGMFCGYGAGTFNFDVTDAKGCNVSSAPVTISEPSKLTATASYTPTSCSSSDGSATCTPAGGTVPYSYLWTPTGQTTNPATGLAAGNYNVQVTDANGCITNANTTVLAGGLAPLQPGPISGPAGACRKQAGVVYCVTADPNATSYVWTLPIGASIQGAANGPCITLKFSSKFNGGFLCVKAVNPCGSSSNSCMNVIKLTAAPATPVSITGSSTACPLTNVNYSIAPVLNASSYAWTASGGILIISGQGTTAVVVSIPAGFTSGNVSVKALNCKGNSGNRTKNVIKDPGCRVAQNRVIDNSINPMLETLSQLNAYPNPTSGKMTVSFESSKDAKYSMKIANVLGSVMIDETISAVEGFNSKLISLENVAKGLYFLTIQTEGDQAKTLRIVVE